MIPGATAVTQVPLAGFPGSSKVIYTPTPPQLLGQKFDSNLVGVDIIPNLRGLIDKK